MTHSAKVKAIVLITLSRMTEFFVIVILGSLATNESSRKLSYAFLPESLTYCNFTQVLSSLICV